MKKSLVVLAAGMGSRYGGLKQMDPVGPGGEFILDYTVYDALQAGFDRVVFVIRRDIEADFREIVGRRIEPHMKVVYVCQELDDLPSGHALPAGRSKPWGTGQAILAARDVVNGPFAVANADDYYGRDALRVLGEFLTETEEDARAYAMVGYRLDRTLSAHGSVSRGVCAVNPVSLLQGITEHTAIRRESDGLIRSEFGELSPETIVSMALYGFKPSFMGHLTRAFDTFLTARGSEERSEFFTPTVLDDLLQAGKATGKVLSTSSSWFGVTNAEDRPGVVSMLADMAAAGLYPKGLWS
jgi:NDP-sugar pyrophosphorylase family protein